MANGQICNGEMGNCEVDHYPCEVYRQLETRLKAIETDRSKGDRAQAETGNSWEHIWFKLQRENEEKPTDLRQKRLKMNPSSQQQKLNSCV